MREATAQPRGKCDDLCSVHVFVLMLFALIPSMFVCVSCWCGVGFFTPQHCPQHEGDLSRPTGRHAPKATFAKL